MPTYYVRKTGNDGNTGLNPTTQAWLTIDHAANNVAAGDTVYIGSGLYREMVTMDTSGTSGNQISFIGDIDGIQTGDAGPVMITAHDTETTASARDYCVDMNEKQFIVWQYVIMNGGDIACYGDSDASINYALDGCELLDCSLLMGDDNADQCVRLNTNVGAVPTTSGFIMDRCVCVGEFHVHFDCNASANVDINMLIQNSIFFGVGITGRRGINFIADNSDVYSIGGIDIVNCLGLGWNSFVYGLRLKDTTNQTRLLNSRMQACQYGVSEVSCDNNAMYEAYNLMGGGASALISGDVQQGGGSSITVSGLALGGIADLMFYKVLGWSPWKPWEPISLLDGTYKEPSIGAASATYAPADDIYGNSRPMGRTSADDAGAVEARVRPQEDTVALDTVAAFLGAGYLDMMAAVDAALTTFTVVGRYDANYAGSLPIFRVLDIPGVADQSDVMTAAANTDETLTCSFTPTSAGYVRIRLESRDTSANGEAYFKDLVKT